MGSKSDYLETAFINHVLRNTALASPTAVYVALYTTLPTDAGGGVEVSGGGYARKVATFDAPSPAGQTQNAADILFAVATATWGTITGWAVLDALTGGNFLYWGNLDTPNVIGIGDRLRFAAGDLQIDED